MNQTVSGVLLLSLLFVATSFAGSQDLEQITPDFDRVHAASGPKDPKHTPKIEAPDTVKAGEWFDVTISVGVDKQHPSLIEHHVHWIALYKNDVELARVYLHPVHTQPKVTFTIALKDSCTLRALEEPNHTAPWEATKSITVTPSAPAAAPAK